MPVISRFLGISITMYYLDHVPPHSHVSFGGRRATVRIRDGMIQGALPPRTAHHVREWLARHRGELVANWWRARSGTPLLQIPPLE